MTDDLIVEVVRKRGLRQQFHVRILDGGNFKVLLTSENYRDLDHAREAGKGWAKLLGATLKDET